MNLSFPGFAGMKKTITTLGVTGQSWAAQDLYFQLELKLASCMQALPFQKPCPQFMESLKTAIKLGSCGAAHGLLCQVHAKASATGQAALTPLYQAAAGIPDRWLRRKMVVLLTAAFNAKQHGLFIAAGPLDDAELVDLLLNNMQPWTEAEVVQSGIAAAIKHHRHRLLSLLLRRPQFQFQEQHLLQVLVNAAASPSSSIEVLKLLLGAVPFWSFSAMVTALSHVSRTDSFSLLTAEAPSPLQAQQLLLRSLAVAAKQGRAAVVQFLLGVSGVHFKEEHLAAALGAAASIGDPSIIQLLLAALPAWSKRTLSSVLAQASSACIIEQLLQAPISEPWQASDLFSPLHAAARQGHWGSVQQILAVSGVQFQELHILPALKAAAQHGSSSSMSRVLQLLLSALPARTKPSLSALLLGLQDANTVGVLLAAAAEPWTPGELLPLAVASAREGRVEVSKKLLRVEGVLYQEADFVNAVKAAVAGQAAHQVLEVLLWAAPNLPKKQLLEGISTATEPCVVALLLAARQDWQPEDLAPCILAAADPGAEGKLKELVSVQGLRFQELHLAPALSKAAAAGPAGVPAVQLLLAKRLCWSKQSLLHAVNQTNCASMVQLLLAAGIGPWRPEEVAIGVAEAAAEGRILTLRQLLMPGIGVQLLREHLTPILLTVATAAAVVDRPRVLETLLKALPAWSELGSYQPAPYHSSYCWQPADIVSCFDAAISAGRSESVQALVACGSHLDWNRGPLREARCRGLCQAAARADLPLVRLLMKQQAVNRDAISAAIFSVPRGATAVMVQLLSSMPWKAVQLQHAISVFASKGDHEVLRVLMSKAQP